MSSEKFCLRWNDFESNISVAFRELRDDKDFFDVTLACDDEQISAHKVILSACSPFFRNILRRNPHQHPLLYLKGVKYTDLQSVLNFMYHGEVNVAQEELNSFLAVAEDLRVKGLTQNQGGASSTVRRPKSPIMKPSVTRPPDREIHQQPPKRPRPAEPPRNNISSLSSISSQAVDDDDIQEVVPVKSEPRDPVPLPQSPMVASTPIYHAPSPVVSTPQPSHSLAPVDDQTIAYQDESYEDYGQYETDQSYDGSMMDAGMMPQAGADGNKGRKQLEEYIEKVFDTESGGVARFKCILCGKINNRKGHAENHLENIHFAGAFSYDCKYCDSTFSSKNSLYKHVHKMHKLI